MPRVTEPFHLPPNPGLYKLYAQGVIGAQNGIKSLQEEWKGVETQNVFEHTRKSLVANTDLSASTSIPSHGWTERERKARKSKKDNHVERTDEVTLTDANVTRLIGEVKQAWPSLKVESQENNHIISVGSWSHADSAIANEASQGTICT